MKLNFFITCIILVLIVSCKKSTPEIYNSAQWNMNRVEGVTSGSLNQTITLTVFYPTSSGSDVFNKFEQSIQDKIVSIKAYGHTVTSNFCTDAAIERNATFSFKSTLTGPFELRFINKDNSYFTHNLTIN
jgi:hypothetical protein